MVRHLKGSSLSRVMCPKDEEDKKSFNPVGVPLIDAVETEKLIGWKYPSSDTMQDFPENHGMGYEMLELCTIKELILNGNQSEEEQRALVEWHYKQMAKDRMIFLGAPLSVDVKEVQATVLDVLRLCRVEKHDGNTVQLSERPGDAS